MSSCGHGGHSLAGLLGAVLIAALPSCGEVEAADPNAGARAEPELPTEVELLERARREIPPERFDEELERLELEILGPEASREQPE